MVVYGLWACVVLPLYPDVVGLKVEDSHLPSN